MQLAVCIVPRAPLRQEAAHRSEMVSELLFGEWAEVLEEGKSFVKIRCSYDGYEGWCQSGQILLKTPAGAGPVPTRLVSEWSGILQFNKQPMHLSLGSPLPIAENGEGQWGHYSFRYEGASVIPAASHFTADAISQLAYQYINTPYLWGGRSVFGIDCSGFVQQVFRFFQKQLPRDAYQQAELGELVGFLQEVQCGDLAYFDNEEGRITHVGLLLNSDTIIHAAGKVRVDKIDNMGIVNGDTGERTHKLRIIKRYF